MIFFNIFHTKTRLPCSPCRCANNCCPGSNCCTGSGCTTNETEKEKEKEKEKIKKEPEIEPRFPRLEEIRERLRNEREKYVPNPQYGG